MVIRFYQSLMMAFVVALTPLLLAASPIVALPKTTLDVVQVGVSQTKLAKPTNPPQPTIATQPQDAKGPVAGWITIAPQQTHWYKFNYHYHSQGKNSEPTQATVKLTRKSKACLSLEIWTAGALQANGQNHKPIGVGSPMKGLGRVLLWVGGSTASETYYVAVKNAATKACPYQLAIAGPDVSY